VRLPWRRTLTKVFGWWRYDAAARALVQSATGARFFFEGWSDGDPALRTARSVNRRWIRFRIEAPEGSYPLLVESRHDQRPAPSMERPWVIRVDHLSSARQWQSETGAASPPPRDLWERIDRFAIDALNAWPFAGDPALNWDWLTLEGGWLGDAWTAQLYRSVRRLSRAPQPHETYDRAAAGHAAGPWRYVAATRPISPEDARDAIAALRSLDPRRIAAALERLREGRPHFAGEDSFALPLFAKGPNPHATRDEELWLLADRTIVTDRLQCVRERLPDGGHRWLWDFETLSGIGTLDRRSGGYASLPPDPMFEVQRNLAGKSFEPPELPSASQLHLRALGEAGLAWRHEIVALPHLDTGQIVAVELAPPEESAGKIYFGGGRKHWSWLATRLSLQGPAEAAEPLAFAFGDGPSADQTLGRLRFHAAALVLHDPGRGETLRLEEAAGESDQGPLTLRFRWTGPSGAFPLLVRREPDMHGRPVWTIDHGLSAAMWREEAGAEGPPPQQAWRPAQEAAVDALLRWPDHPSTGRTAPVLSRGGWAAGRWCGDMVRRFDIGARSFDSTGPELTAEPEQDWHLLPGETVAEQKDLTPATLKEAHGGDIEHVLAAHPALYGVLRADRAAVLAFVRTEQRPYREDDVLYTQVWLYADRDVALELRDEQFWGLRLDPVSRPEALRADSAPLWHKPRFDTAPTPLLWRRLFVAVEAQAWLRHADARLPVKLSGGPLAGGAAGLEIRLWRE
jgi:hypothetical protein